MSIFYKTYNYIKLAKPVGTVKELQFGSRSIQFLELKWKTKVAERECAYFARLLGSPDQNKRNDICQMCGYKDINDAMEKSFGEK